MPIINLDPRKLLGFKIIANNESSATLRSPKIGGKGCPIINADVTPAIVGSRAATKI